MAEKSYVCIDLKSFYASVECRERQLDPLTTNLVVADSSRTSKTICLAVSPSLKKYGISGRARLFEVIQQVKMANARRGIQVGEEGTCAKSYDAKVLDAQKKVAIDYIIAPPRMALYVTYSTQIYQVYLKYVAPEDIHIYSIDEVFMDVTNYLHTYNMTATELARTIMQDVWKTTGITATAGIGSNLYLGKIAMDIVAKHAEPDEYGARIAELDETSYRKTLWTHRPLTDFWRVGSGYAKKLEKIGIYTMGDIARCSIGDKYEYYNEELLYKLFGINAELLIDHAWGWEPCTIADVKAYKPSTNSICSGQVLQEPYDYERGLVVVREMTELMALDLVSKKLVTDQIVLTVGYDIENLTDMKRSASYIGEVTIDNYGRAVPKHAHGTTNFGSHTSSTKKMVSGVMELYERIMNPNLLIRRFSMSANHVLPEDQVLNKGTFEQMNFFTDYEKIESEKKELEREKKMQHAILEIQNKYGKNAILKGTSYTEGATTKERNQRIGGHKA